MFATALSNAQGRCMLAVNLDREATVVFVIHDFDDWLWIEARRSDCSYLLCQHS